MGKRTIETIDLTEDNENRPQAKYARVNQASQPTASQSLASGDILISSQDNDENEIVDLSQAIDDGLAWVCIGAIDAKIVGIRYYNGYATMGESVLLRREPQNQYDRNAIAVQNVQGEQIGHIPRTLAAKLAPYMDAKECITEGVLAGEKGFYDCPILIKVFGPMDARLRAELEQKMQSDRLGLKKRGIAAPKNLQSSRSALPPTRKKLGYQSSSQPGSSQQEEEDESSQPSLQDFVLNSEQFRPRDIEEIVEQWGAPQETLEKMPMAEQPDKLVSVLLPYQRQGLAWLLDKESPVLPEVGSKDVVQLWRRPASRPNAFQNIATQFVTATPPVLASGGILADDMGLGKTLQVISLILQGGAGTTLILAPVSVMSNWAQQMERHIKKEHALKVLTYHGSNRKRMTAINFAEYDVVITTYGTLSTEYMPRGVKQAPAVPRKDGLFSMTWRRVVLDEGHIIRNPRTKAAVAASSLLSKSRWVLTGTPIVNNITDLYSMLKFIGITGGLERQELFNAILARPLTVGDPNAEQLLQTIMRTMCLRRKKDMKFIDLKLPELSEYIHRIKFRDDEKEKYEALSLEAKGLLHKYQSAKGKGKGKANGKGAANYNNLLEVLLRLRQVCCHWKLCGSRVSDLLALLEKDDVIVLNKDTRLALQALLQISIDNRDECSICLDELHNPVITTCKHVFGRECIERTIGLQHKCPMCRAELANTECLVEPAEEKIDENTEAEIDTETKSSKTEALMSILKASRKDPLSKVVIFSQWTSFLNIIQVQLAEAGMKYTRIDGSMPAHARDAAIAALDNDPETKIMLASLSVCSVGLNLVSADTVILADSWWAPAIEDQAVDRVHRLGQTRKCTVWRLIMEGSIEERVLEIQAEKRKLVGKAFQEKAKGGAEKTTRMADILKLLA
ncbi:SNF2 family N-terminal domain-containing protein [Xylogone sp. PMI_703]|nr:SNF2 family N-terminal domain-containing protein [Xylogone sp. PMI_703]